MHLLFKDEIYLHMQTHIISDSKKKYLEIHRSGHSKWDFGHADRAFDVALQIVGRVVATFGPKGGAV